jgi:hypothetical protein
LVSSRHSITSRPLSSSTATEIVACWTSNGGSGIGLNDGVVTRCTVDLNQGNGIEAQVATLSLNTVSGNGKAGISGGGLVNNNTVLSNGTNGIQSAVSVINNAVFANGGYGVSQGALGFGYGSNVLTNNVLGPANGGTSMRNNVCGGVGATTGAVC